MSSVCDQTLFAIGQPVLLHIGRNSLPGVVIEDRGLFGSERERILRIRVEYGHDEEASEFEVPEEALEELPAV